MIIFSPSYGYSEFRRISSTVAVIKSIGIETINNIWGAKPFRHLKTIVHLCINLPFSSDNFMEAIII